MAAENKSNQGEHGRVKSTAKVTLNETFQHGLPLTSPPQQDNHSTGSL